MHYFLEIFFGSLFFNVLIADIIDVDHSKSVAWGPGLNPADLVFPARYFFVQLYDSTGQKIVKSPEAQLEVHIGSNTKSKPCRVWSNVLNRNDGSFIIRFKVYTTCEDFKIDLRYDNMPIQGFPMIFNRVVLPEDCNCPRNLDSWLDKMECKREYAQMKQDLKKFKNIKFSKMRKKVLERYNQPGSVSLCHYVVKNNEVHRQCYGEYVGFKVFMDSILLSLARKVKLPDLEFFSNLGDWPLAKSGPDPFPIFSWCGSDTTSDIIMPTYDLTEATLECMGRVQLDMLSVQGNTGPKWEDKIDKAFWRGRDSRQERLDLIDIARKNPDLINASLTNFFFFRDKEDEYGPKVPHISFFEFFNYKYQICIDGTVASYRLPYLLAGDSVVLKQDSPYFEHFYKDLIPNVHYVPFKRDLSNLVTQIKWIMENEEKAKNISRNAREFARESLMPKDVFCYYAILLKEWSSRLSESPSILEEMEHVKQPDTESSCVCPDESLKDEL